MISLDNVSCFDADVVSAIKPPDEPYPKDGLSINTVKQETIDVNLLKRIILM